MKKLIPLLVVLFAFVCCKNDKTKDDPYPDGENSSEKNTAESNDSSYPTDVFWGDTHLHTDLSMDAGAFGNRIGMDEAYKFARGDEVTSSTGLKTRLSRPLDFLVIADHSDGMGLFPAIVNKEDWVMNATEGPRWRKMYEEGKNSEMAMDIIKNFSQGNFSFATNDPKNNDPGLGKCSGCC